jgi:hypothetical protein
VVFLDSHADEDARELMNDRVVVFAECCVEFGFELRERRRDHRQGSMMTTFAVGRESLKRNAFGGALRIS